MTLRILLILGFVWAGVGWAQSTIVTLCPLDTQAGAGVNFAAAMAKGGNITFGLACNTVHLTRTYPVSVRTSIDGDNRITLDTTKALGTLGMFEIEGGVELGLSQITLKPVTAFGVATGQNAANGRVTMYRTHVAGPTLSGVSGVGTVSSVHGTFANIAGVALAAGNVDFESSECDNCGAAIESTITGSAVGSTFSGGSNGVVCETGTLNITGSHFLNYTAGAVRTWCATVIANTDFKNNKADTGGAIAVNPVMVGVNPQAGPQSASVTITGGTFTGNSATGAGGALSVRSSAVAAPLVVLRHVVFTSNTADQGGAVDLGGYVLRGVALDASAVAFTGNSAVHDGGGMHGMNVSGRLTRGVFANNKSGGVGGGAGMTSASPRALIFANGLFVGNTAVKGSAYSGPGAQFINSTVAGNSGTAISVVQSSSAGVVSGGSVGKGSLASQVSMVNSIVSGNPVNCAGFTGLTGPIIVDGGHNDQFPGSGCNGSIPANDPQLDTMFVPAPNNAVLTGGDNTVCAGADVGNRDVWAQYRPRGANCSMGAIEGGMESVVLQANPGTVLPTRGGDFSLTASPGSQGVSDSTGTVQYKIGVTAVGGFSGTVVFGVSNVPSGMSASFAPASGTVATGSVLTVVNGPLVTPGSYTVAVSGTSGAVTHSVSVTLVVGRSTN